MKTIRWLGDSTVRGVTRNSPTEAYYFTELNTPNIATSLLRKKLGTGSVQSFNDGVPGSSLAQWYGGGMVSGYPVMPSLAARMETPEYQSMHIGVLEIGINDIAAGTTPEQFAWYIQKFKETFEAHGKQLVLSTPNPINDPSWESLRPLQAKTQELAAWFKLPLINHYDAITDQTMSNWRDMLCDNAHPSEIMYSLKGSLAAAILEPLVAAT